MAEPAGGGGETDVGQPDEGPLFGETPEKLTA
jgi:hypothetical protein